MTREEITYEAIVANTHVPVAYEQGLKHLISLVYTDTPESQKELEAYKEAKDKLMGIPSGIYFLVRHFKDTFAFIDRINKWNEVHNTYNPCVCSGCVPNVYMRAVKLTKSKET